MNKSKQQSGFTVIEIVVAAGIFAMIALLYVTNFKSFAQGRAVESNADKIAANIRQAQIWTLTGELAPSGSRPYGYGINIDSPCTSGTCTYKVFADTCNPTNHVYDNGCDTIVSTEPLDALVSVASVSPSGPLTLLFTMPGADIYTNTTAAQSASITLSHRAVSNKTKVVSIDGVSGQVNVQ